jgi:hypothetical protein
MVSDSIRVDGRYLEWTSVIAGALCAAAFSLILVTFAIAVGLGVSSASPTWRDASAALAILSGLYLIIQAITCFGIGGYIAGRTRSPVAAVATEEVERQDGLHGLASWALAVVLGAVLATILSAAAVNRPTLSPRSTSLTANATAAEPILSYELDRLFRAARRAPNIDLATERSEAGRILLTSSSHSGVTGDDRTYLIQLVASTTGIPPGEAERRVDTAITDAKTAINRSRRSTIIVAFSVAAATLLGAVAAWAAACAGGRHRDGAPVPNWMLHSNRFGRTRIPVNQSESRPPRRSLDDDTSAVCGAMRVNLLLPGSAFLEA